MITVVRLVAVSAAGKPIYRTMRRFQTAVQAKRWIAKLKDQEAVRDGLYLISRGRN